MLQKGLIFLYGVANLFGPGEPPNPIPLQHLQLQCRLTILHATDLPYTHLKGNHQDLWINEDSWQKPGLANT